MSDAPTKRSTPAQEQKPRRQNAAGLLKIYPLGKDVPAMHYFVLGATVSTAGRALDCEIPLPEDDEASRRHASVEISASTCLVKDLGSTNGIFVNAEQVKSATLGDGDLLRVGSSLFVYFAKERGLARTSCELPLEPSALVGGPSMERARQILTRFAQSDLPALLLGETGTGKEVAANLLHDRGPRSAGPFVSVNCAALPAEIFESQLFGHRKGAFTGADRDELGLIRKADGGTLFLDEIGELPLATQPKLLRALQEKRVLPVGATDALAVDFRLVCATNVDLHQKIDTGDFRDDLFARISTLELSMPSLRERREDIPLLAEHFAKKHGGDACALTVDAMERVSCQAFPRNVRQLESTIQRAIVIADDLTALDVPLVSATESASSVAPPKSADARALHDALIAAEGNVKLAAKTLELSRSQLYRRAEKLGVDLARYRKK